MVDFLENKPQVKIKTPLKAKINGYPIGPIINPPIRAPKAVDKGEKIVSTAADSSGYFFNLLDNNPLLPEFVIKLPMFLPSIIAKIR